MTAIMDLAGLDDGRVALSADQLDALDARLDGALVRPGDEGWGAAVLIWNGMVATTPALVVQPASVRDVAATSPSPATTACCSASRAGATTSPAPPSPSRG